MTIESLGRLGRLGASSRVLLPVALAAVAAVAGCKKEEAAAGAGQEMPPPLVVAVKAEQRDVPHYIDAIGKIVPLEAVTITPRIDGPIVERKFEDGADVKKGQVLFRIDPAPTEAEVASAKAQLAQAIAARNFAKIELDRYAAVANTQAISKSDYDTKRNAVEVAEAQVAAAEAAVRTAEIRLGFCTIVSPIDGRAGSRLVDVGNVVRENETALLSVQSVAPIYADFTVNEQQLSAVRQYMAKQTLKTFVKLPTDGNDGEEGTLTFLDNSVQQGSGTIRLRATIDNKNAHFWPGQFVQVRLVLETLQGAVLVPSAAPQTSQAGPFVLVVKPDSTAEMRPIERGQVQGDKVVIAKGLAAGEQVITDGQLMVRPGGPVRLDGGQGGPPAPKQGDDNAANAGGAK